MKFEVEAISDERFLFVDAAGEVKIIPDAELGDTLRKIAVGTPAPKRAYPKGTRKRRKAATVVGGGTTTYANVPTTPTKEG